MFAQFRLAPIVAGRLLGAGGVAVARRLEQDVGRRRVERGIVARRKAVAFERAPDPASSLTNALDMSRLPFDASGHPAQRSPKLVAALRDLLQFLEQRRVDVVKLKHALPCIRFLNAGDIPSRTWGPYTGIK